MIYSYFTPSPSNWFHILQMQHCFGGFKLNQLSSYRMACVGIGYGGHVATGADQRPVKREMRQRSYSTCEGTRMLCGLMICARVCIFIGRYSYFFCLARSLVSWPINNPHLLSWQLAPHFCPSLPARSPERPGLRHLGDKLPISPVEHLWGWALLQSSSSTWRKERRDKL